MNIPINPQMTDDTVSRFSGAEWFFKAQEKVIIFGGAGGISSWAIMMIARLKPKSIFIYDDDTVDSVNMAGQLYSIEQIGLKKVNAVASMISKYSSYNDVFAVSTKYDTECPATDIMICGFDNMEARKVFFNNWLNYVNNKATSEEKAKCLFIDARLSAEEFQVFCFTGADDYYLTEYQDKYLFEDTEAEAAVCSYKQTAYCANLVAGIMANLFINHCTNECGLFRDLPFLTRYNGATMFLKTIS